MKATFNIPSDTFVRPQKNGSATTHSNRVFFETLSNPVGYPALDKVVYPGDCLTVVLLDDLVLPDFCATEILCALSDLLHDVSIAVVSNQPLSIADKDLERLNSKFDKAELNVSFEVHEPGDSSKSAQIAINKRGDALHVNRTIFDADVVLPVGSDFAGGSHQSSIFPTFGTTSCKERLKSQDLTESEIKGEIRMVEAALGLNLGVNVYQSPGGAIDRVVCGEKDAIANANAESKSSWQVRPLTEGQTVVATIETPSPTWDQFFQALVNAANVCAECERIVICSEIAETPGALHRSVLELQFESDQNTVANVLSQINESFQQVPYILEEKSVYLKSELSANEVEELGLGYVDNDDQIQQIIDNSESGVYLRDAQLCEIVEAN